MSDQPNAIDQICDVVRQQLEAARASKAVVDFKLNAGVLRHVGNDHYTYASDTGGRTIVIRIKQQRVIDFGVRNLPNERNPAAESPTLVAVDQFNNVIPLAWWTGTAWEPTGVAVSYLGPRLAAIRACPEPNEVRAGNFTRPATPEDFELAVRALRKAGYVPNEERV